VVPLAPHQKFFYPSFKKMKIRPCHQDNYLLAILSIAAFFIISMPYFYHLPLFSFLDLFLVPSVQQNLCGII
jgi:hypothetical protein